MRQAVGRDWISETWRQLPVPALAVACFGLAQALLNEPDLVFLDEPTSGLDPVMTAVISQLIREISSSLGVASVVVTHDMEIAAMADRVEKLDEINRVFAANPTT